MTTECSRSVHSIVYKKFSGNSKKFVRSFIIICIETFLQGGNEFMSIAIRANQSGVDQAAAQKAAEKKDIRMSIKSVNAGGFTA